LLTIAPCRVGLSDCRGESEKIVKKSGEPHKLRRRRSSIAANLAAHHILFGGGGVAHSRLAAAAEFGGSGV